MSVLTSLLCSESGMFLLSGSCQLSLPSLGWLTERWGKNTKALWVMALMGTQSKWCCLGNKALRSNLLRKFGEGHRNWMTFILLERNTLCSCVYSNKITFLLGIILTGWLFKSAVAQHFESFFVITFLFHPLSFVCTLSGPSFCLDFIFFCPRELLYLVLFSCLLFSRANLLVFLHFVVLFAI